MQCSLFSNLKAQNVLNMFLIFLLFKKLLFFKLEREAHVKVSHIFTMIDSSPVLQNKEQDSAAKESKF